MSFNVICGMPRSGSSLLCAILNQNKDFYASPTSPVVYSVNAQVSTLSGAIETKAALSHSKDEALKRLHESIRSSVDGYYSQIEQDIIFDKSRGWMNSAQILENLYPGAKLLVCVRDLRDVFASIEKQNSKEPLLDATQSPQQRSLIERADAQCSPGGMIGSCVNGVMDLARRDNDNVILIKYEELAKKPKWVMSEVYENLGVDYFEHDFDNVKSRPEDVAEDHLYLYKFPHVVAGKVEPKDSQRDEFVSKDIQELIYAKFPKYNELCGYTK